MVDSVFAKSVEALARLKYSPKTGWIRRYTNLLYYDPRTVVLGLYKLKMIEMNGCKFYANEALEALRDMSGNPWLEGTRPDDTVLDIGAHMGVMCIPLALKVKRVYAVEPLYAEELRRNLALNGLNNVEVWEMALGSGSPIRLWYRTRQATVPTLSLTEMRNRTGSIDFIKLNCEGGEWTVMPEEYEGIREIRLDYHVGRTDRKTREVGLRDLLSWLKGNGYTFEVEYYDLGLNPQHKGRYQIMASKEP